MKQKTSSKHSMINLGYTFAKYSEYSDEQKRKKEFVSKYLEPAIVASKCGWRHARYYLLKSANGHRVEYVVLSNRENGNTTEGRYICVSMDSLASIMLDVMDNIYS